MCFITSLGFYAANISAGISKFTGVVVKGAIPYGGNGEVGTYMGKHYCSDIIEYSYKLPLFYVASIN